MRSHIVNISNMQHARYKEMVSNIITLRYDIYISIYPACLQCLAPGTLKHILVGCKTSLTQGRYTWRHNQMMKCLAVTLESKRVTVNAMPLEAQTTFHQLTSFVREGEKCSTNRSSPDLCPLNAAQDWEMRVDLSQRLTFPPEITATNMRPDLVLWSKSCRQVFIVELTVPWEEAIDEAFERKWLRYADLAAEAEDRGWKVNVRPVEVGCRGFVASSTTRLLKEVGIRGQVQRKTIKDLATAAERSSHWLLLKRKETVWAPKWPYGAFGATHTLCAVHRLDQAPEVPLQCLCLPQLGVVHPCMQHDWSNVLFALQDRGYLRRNIGNTSTRETAWMCPHLHSKLDINPPLKQVTVKLCSVDQTITVQRGSVLDVRIQSDFSSPFAHSGWVQFLESGEFCTNGSLSSPDYPQ